MNQHSSLLHSRYEIIKKLGEGGFGTVYLAKDQQSSSYCVVKRLNADADKVEVMTRLFREEIDILKKLNHSQIPRLIDDFVINEEFYLVQEYIVGHTLSHELGEGRPWPEPQVLSLLQEGLEILNYIHSLGVIHRDIKPDNLIRRDGDRKLVLIDFGAVKNFDIDQSHVINRTVAVGTHGYMPTEQARGRPRRNSDIYALGMIAIQALTGVNPINVREDEDTGEILWSQFGEIHPSLRHILGMMTRSNYTKRYKSADLALADLQKYLSWRELVESQPISAPSAQDVLHRNQEATLVNRSYSPFNKNVLPISLTLVSLIVLGGGGALVYARNQEKQEFLNTLESHLVNQDFEKCIETATSMKAMKTIPKEKNEYLGKCRMQYASQKADSSDLVEAIRIANGIPDDNPFYEEAQAMVDKWTNDLNNPPEDCPPGVFCVPEFLN
ncbi:MAG: serine/threonine protein kinase [Cyanobacterium sp. T60_A2020_053]|nr:serine/threonine protein kinase [Cyanobacterium sp. T60_A2020_053]